MTIALATSEVIAPDQGTSDGPNWDQVPFDVGCARCGYDLRGLDEPVCPACNLEFDWSDAVPLEELTCLHCGYHLCGLHDTRCPECGERFTWPEVLAEYRRRNKEVFEYRWHGKPIHSLARTWLLAMRPSKLWAKFDLHDPPRIGPLIAMTIVAIAALLAMNATLETTSTAVSAYRWGGTTPQVGNMLIEWAVCLFSWDNCRFLAPVLFYFAILLVGLLLFRQTMQRCQVRLGHVIRMWAYAVPMIWPVLCIGALGCVVAAVFTDRITYYRIDFWLAGIGMSYVTWSMYRAGKTYLCIPHSLAVAISIQMMGILGTTACDNLFGDALFTHFLRWALDGVGIL